MDCLQIGWLVVVGGDNMVRKMNGSDEMEVVFSHKVI